MHQNMEMINSIVKSHHAEKVSQTENFVNPNTFIFIFFIN